MQKSNNWKSLAISTVVRCALLVVIFGAVYVLTNHLAAALLAVTGFSILFYLIFDQRSNPRDQDGRAFRFLPADFGSPPGLNDPIASVGGFQCRHVSDHKCSPFSDRSHPGAGRTWFFCGGVAFRAGRRRRNRIRWSCNSCRSWPKRSGTGGSVEFWRQLIGIMVVIQVACGVGIVASVVVGGELLRLLYGNVFAGQAALMTAAAVAAGPVYCASIAANGCYAAGLRRGLLAAQVIALLTVMLTTLLALRSWGNFGAFGAMLAAGIIQLRFCLVFLRRFWRRYRKQDQRALPEGRS